MDFRPTVSLGTVSETTPVSPVATALKAVAQARTRPFQGIGDSLGLARRKYTRKKVIERDALQALKAWPKMRSWYRKLLQFTEGTSVKVETYFYSGLPPDAPPSIAGIKISFPKWRHGYRGFTPKGSAETDAAKGLRMWPGMPGLYRSLEKIAAERLVKPKISLHKLSFPRIAKLEISFPKD